MGAETVTLVADHAGAVLPPEEKRITDATRLLDQPIVVLRNGEILGQSTSSGIPGGPFASVCRLVEHLALYGIRLHADQVILTGSPLPLYPVHSGDAIEVRTASWGEVRARIGS